MELSLIKDLYDILKDIITGVRQASDVPSEKRQALKDALKETAELINSALTLTKEKIHSVLRAIKFKTDPQEEKEVRELIFSLESFHEWHNRFREFQLCDPLREAYKKLDKTEAFSFFNRATQQNNSQIAMVVGNFLASESQFAGVISHSLSELSKLEAKIPDERAEVVAALEKSYAQIKGIINDFIALEREIITYI